MSDQVHQGTLFGDQAMLTPPAGIMVGCAGWSLSSAVQPRFPAEGSHLERYAHVFPAVEINSSFYRPHKPSTYARWRDSVPPGFRFSLKLPREITHERRLRDIDEPVAVFLDAASHLADRFGCLLVQMPPSLAFDQAAASSLFARLRERLQAGIACEPRHQSWFGKEATELLAKFQIGRVLADPQVALDPMPALYQGLVYVRLHGSPVIYHSDYPEDCLRRNAAWLARQQRQGREVWCIFDNTASGAAVPNALTTLALTDAYCSDQRGGAGAGPGGGGGGLG
jgi:uncharacterized protein YecE (DUF72 family)